MFNFGDEPHLLPSILESTGPPSLCDEFISRFHRCSKSCLIFFDIGWVAGSQNFEEPMASCVPREQAMHDGASKTHPLTWFRSSMEGIVVPVQSGKSVSNMKDQNDLCRVPIQMSGLFCRLERMYCIGLLALGRRVIDGAWT